MKIGTIARLTLRLMGRSRRTVVALLIVIALPVLVSTAYASVRATSALTITKAETYAFGHATGRLTQSDSAGRPSATPRFPAGWHVVEDVDVVDASIESSGGASAAVSGRVLDLTDPLAQGIYANVSGVPATDAATVAVSRALARQLHVGVGDEVRLCGTAVRVTTVFDDPTDTTRRMFVAPPTWLTAHRDALAAAHASTGVPRWLADTSGQPDSRASVVAAATGLLYTPRKSIDTLITQKSSTDTMGVTIGLGLMVEGLMLVAAGLAVVYRKEYRTIGLLLAMGAAVKDARRYLSLYTVLVAAAGAVLGACAGIACTAAILRPLQTSAHEVWGAPVIPYSTIGITVCAAILVALIASRVTSRSLTKSAPVDVLRAVQSVGRGSARGLVIGSAALILAMIAFALLLLVPSGSASAVMATIAVVAGCAGGGALLVYGLNHWDKSAFHDSMGTAPRVAISYLRAHSRRSTIAIVALAELVALSLLALVIVNSVVQKQRDEYQPASPLNSALIAPPRPLSYTELLSLKSATSAGAVVGPIQRAALPVAGQPRPLMPVTDFEQCLQQKNLLTEGGTNDWNPCYTQAHSHVPFPAVAIGTAASLEGLFTLTPSQVATYDAGSTALTLDRAGLVGGHPNTVTLAYPDYSGDRLHLITIGELKIEGVAKTSAEYTNFPRVFISPVAARHLHTIPINGANYLLPVPSSHISADYVKLALPADIQTETQVTIERGYTASGAIPLLRQIVTAIVLLTCISLLASLLILWLRDMERDYLMLGALGGSISWRRQVGASMGSLMTTAGLCVGAVFGLLASFLFLSAVGTHAALPWESLILVITVITLVGVSLGYLVVPRGSQAMRRA